MKFSFKTVKNLTNFLKACKPTDYEIFDGDCGDILVTIYTCGNIEVYIGKEGYEVIFSDYSEYEKLTLNEVVEAINNWCDKWNSNK